MYDINGATCGAVWYRPVTAAQHLLAAKCSWDGKHSCVWCPACSSTGVREWSPVRGERQSSAAVAHKRGAAPSFYAVYHTDSYQWVLMHA